MCHSMWDVPHLAEQIREDHIPWNRPLDTVFLVWKLPGEEGWPRNRRMDVQLGVWSLKVPRFWRFRWVIFWGENKDQVVMLSNIRFSHYEAESIFTCSWNGKNKIDQPLSSREQTNPTNWKGNIFLPTTVGGDMLLTRTASVQQLACPVNVQEFHHDDGAKNNIQHCILVFSGVQKQCIQQNKHHKLAL